MVTTGLDLLHTSGEARPHASRRTNVVMTALSTWFVLGLFVDAYAHANLSRLESFFTPWHAVFYSGFAATAGWVLWTIWRQVQRGRRGIAAVPLGYGATVVALPVFAVSGAVDAVWHTVLGIETSTDIFFSPSHLGLFAAMVVILTSPFRSAWGDPDLGPCPSMRALLPAVLGLALTTSLVLLFLTYGNALLFFGDSVVTLLSTLEEGDAETLAARIVLTDLVLLAPLLLLARRWPLPPGAATVVYLAAATVSGTLTGFENVGTLVAAVAAGVGVDVLARFVAPHRRAARRVRGVRRAGTAGHLVDLPGCGIRRGRPAARRDRDVDRHPDRRRAARLAARPADGPPAGPAAGPPQVPVRAGARFGGVPATIELPSVAMHRATLPNGLRVLLVPDPTTPVVGVAVHVDVGFRSEPEGRTGFAHLFEHLMFQGSESLEKLAHFRHVQSSGGVFNGSTHQDYTDYFEVLPAAALERALFLEADRLRAPEADRGEPAQPGRRGQGGDPAQRAEPAVRRVPVDPAAAGAVRHLPQRAQRLRRLLRAGAGQPRRRRRVLRHLLRAGQRRCSRSPATSTSTRRCGWSRSTSATSRPAPTPHRPVVRRAAAERPSAARRCPTRTPRCPRWRSATGCPTRPPTWTATSRTRCWRSVLSDGEAARLQRRLVHADGLVTDVSAGAGLMGPLDARDPDTFTITAVHPTDGRPGPGARRGRRGAGQAGRRRARAPTSWPGRWPAGRPRCTSEHDRVMYRMLGLGARELLYGRAEICRRAARTGWPRSPRSRSRRPRRRCARPGAACWSSSRAPRTTAARTGCRRDRHHRDRTAAPRRSVAPSSARVRCRRSA